MEFRRPTAGNHGMSRVTACRRGECMSRPRLESRGRRASRENVVAGYAIVPYMVEENERKSRSYVRACLITQNAMSASPRRSRRR